MSAYFAARRRRPNKVLATAAELDDYKSPNPDPGEHFDRICAQIFGPGADRVKPANNQMLGFLLDYADSAGTTGAADNMRHYTPQ